MTKRDMLAMTATEMSAGFAHGDISPVEVVDASLAAAAWVSERLNAIASLDADRARADAALSAARWRAHAPLGPLDGVPITFKDSFHVIGLPRWLGTAVNAGVVSTIDAAPVRRARDEGMIVIAKTTMPDYALIMSGVSSQHGIIRNAWDLDTNPGGSSAGAGPSVTAGVAPIAVGTDMVGSVRLPAALSGLASIKPTQGRIAYDPAGNYRSAGPMAKSVDDVEQALRVLGQTDAADHVALDGRYMPGAHFTSLSGKTVGVLRALSFGDTVDDDTAAAVDLQASRLADLGAAITDIDDLAAKTADYDAIYWFMVYKGIADFYAADSAARERILPEIGAMMDQTLQQSALFAAQVGKRLALGTEAVRQQLAPFDYILSPALPMRAFAATDIRPSKAGGPMGHMGFACWFNQLGWPAGTVPVLAARHGGCPVSVQIAGQRFDDAGVLQVMRLLEAARGFDIAYPIVSL